MSEPFAIVRAGYDAIGTRYRDRSQHNPVRLHWVDRLLGEVAPGSLIVELGCGAGEPATRLLSEQHRVLGVDASATQLRLAKEAAPNALLLQADMTRLSLRAGSVDAVASFYALGHVPAHEHAPLLVRVAAWLRPGGLLLTSAPLTTEDGEDADWLGVQMFFGGIGEAATRAALDAAGLAVLDCQVVPEGEGDRHTVRFLWLLAQRPL